MTEELYQRVRAGIDWGRVGPWPPDAITALDELVALTPNRRDSEMIESASDAKVQRVWIEVLPDLDADASYLEQEGFEDRLEQYRNGSFGFVGVRVCAELLVPVNNQLVGQIVSSPGLWGIEDDASEGYIRDVASDEHSTLVEMLHELHVPFFAGDGCDYTDCRIEWVPA